MGSGQSSRPQKERLSNVENWDKERPDIQWILRASDIVCIWGGNYFTDILPPSNDWLIWHKKNDNLSFSEVEMAWTTFGKNTRHYSHHWGGEEKIHITQKPLRVMLWVMSFLPPEITIYDPYMGSGTTGIAAIQTGRKFIGCEINPDYFAIAERRIAQAALQPGLFTASNTARTGATMPQGKQGELFGAVTGSDGGE